MFYNLKSTVFWSSGKMTDCYAKPFKVSNPSYFMLLTTSVMEIPVLVHSNSGVCDIRWLQPGSLVDIIVSPDARMLTQESHRAELLFEMSEAGKR